eukprot:TRINITY_DN1596_c0_g1_i1.p1 TRINITY_DN1596_c0_g1~~TRINITY_DN1596_c0_g1_i1.p1  ORF type:complete len:560 (-),score=111.41 TRINITY_DN1596_c0_g1_i1:1399-3078(-)
MMDFLVEDERVGAIVIAMGHGRPVEGFSCDYHAPNAESAYVRPSGHSWNPSGSGLCFQRIYKPIISLSGGAARDAESNAVKNHDRNFEYPLHGIRIEMEQLGYQKSSRCLNRYGCGALGDDSVWARLPSDDDDSFSLNETRSAVMVISNFDGLSMLPFQSVAAHGTAGKISAFLGAFDALSRSNRTSLPFEIVFAAFNGESIGYTGSRRFLWDVEHFRCDKYSDDGQSCDEPLCRDMSFRSLRIEEPDGIDVILELDTLGHVNAGNKMYIHPFPDMKSSSSLLCHENTFKLLQLPSEENLVVSETTWPELPPSSSHSFVRAVQREEIDAIKEGGCVISDYDSEYVNPYFHSIHDNIRSDVNTSVLCDASKLAARWAFLAASNGTLAPDDVHSFVASVDCNLVQTVYDDLSSMENFVGFYGWDREISDITEYILRFMAVRTELHPSDMNVRACDSSDDCPWNGYCLGHMCIQSQAHLHRVFSPSLRFDFGAKKWKVRKEDGDHPPYTISYVSSFSGVQFCTLESWVKDAIQMGSVLLCLVIWTLAVTQFLQWLARKDKVE